MSKGLEREATISVHFNQVLMEDAVTQWIVLIAGCLTCSTVGVAAA